MEVTVVVAIAVPRCALRLRLQLAGACATPGQAMCTKSDESERYLQELADAGDEA